MIWRTIKSYPLYEVSNDGQVRSLPIKAVTDSTILLHGGELLKQYISNVGYYYVRLLNFESLRFECVAVHRLVAEAFIPNLRKVSDVHHIDENKLNNDVGNLAWCSRSENMRSGTVQRRISNKLSSPVVQLSMGGVYIRTWSSSCATSDAGFHFSNVAACCRGDRKSAGGYKWMYAKDYFGGDEID